MLASLSLSLNAACFSFPTYISHSTAIGQTSFGLLVTTARKKRGDICTFLNDTLFSSIHLSFPMEAETARASAMLRDAVVIVDVFLIDGDNMLSEVGALT